MINFALTGLFFWVTVICLAAKTLSFWGKTQVSTAPWDAVVIAGCKVLPNGQPSAALYRRCVHGIACWKDSVALNPGSVLVVTGANGEAKAAAQLARESGVPEKAIVIENFSRNTRENAAYTAAACPQLKRILVVSDDYHLARCRKIFGKRFYEVELSATNVSNFRSSLKELVSWCKELWLSLMEYR